MRPMRRFLAALTVTCVASVAAAAPPARVVSMNLCLDQLALLVAAPGQLVSVSDWAVKPSASNMVEEAAALPLNAGGAEQIFLLAPDLVLAGTFSNSVAVDMLRRLGVRVETFAPAGSLAEIGGAIRRLGAMLGREARADAVVAAFEAEIAALAAQVDGLAEEPAAYHYPNNYTSGADTLADEALTRGGFANAAAALGLAGVVWVPLETLVMSRPALIRTEHISGGAAGRSFETARHPALAALAQDGRGAVVEERWQVCGTPFVTRAVAELVASRLALAAQPAGD